MNFTKCGMMILALSLPAELGSGLILTEARANAVTSPQAPPAQVPSKVKAEPKPDNDRIVGVWRLAKGQADGKALAAEVTTFTRLTFTKDGEFINNLADEGDGGKYKLVAAGKIDVSNKEGIDFSPGIYQFEGDDRLTLCFRLGNPDQRPTEFSGSKGSGQMLLVLNRVKPGEEKLTPEEIARFKEIDKVREAAVRTRSINNLKHIGLAMHNYHFTHKTFPAHAIYSKDGKTPLLSWRVAILPYLDEQALYDEFKLDEPWDSKHNKKLIVKMPKLYEPLGEGKKGEGLTYYQVFTGPNTVFDGPKKMKIQAITDGTSNTLLAIEAKDAVVWTRPADLTLPKAKDKLPAVGGLFNNVNALFCDATVRSLSRAVPPAVLRSLITPAGGEVIDFSKIDPE
jgi:uncharacterized protein (TIGR03067 family)